MMFGEFPQFRNVLSVKIAGDFVGAVPMGVVGSHHASAVAGAPPFVVPEFEPDEVDLVAELRLAEERAGGLVKRKARFRKLLVIEIDQGVVLIVEGVDVALGVSVYADIDHICPTRLPRYICAWESHFSIGDFRSNRNRGAVVP